MSRLEKAHATKRQPCFRALPPRSRDMSRSESSSPTVERNSTRRIGCLDAENEVWSQIRYL